MFILVHPTKETDQAEAHDGVVKDYFWELIVLYWLGVCCVGKVVGHSHFGDDLAPLLDR